MPDKKIDPQVNLTEQIPGWKLKLVYFYTQHKIVIKRGLIFLLFFIDVLVVFLFGAILVNYQTGIIADQSYLRQMPVSLVNHHVIKDKMKPQELVILDVKSMPGQNNKYDLLAVVKNNNQQWAITKLDYTFNVNDQDLESRTTFILPKSEKRLMYFNADKGSHAKLKIININWQRIRDFSLLSYKDGLKIIRSSYTPRFSGLLFGETLITFFNDTPYNFWEVGLPIVLYDRNSNPIAIDYVVINKVLAQEQRQLSTSWHQPIRSTVSKAEVYPEINLLDESVIMELEAEPGSPSGLE